MNINRVPIKPFFVFHHVLCKIWKKFFEILATKHKFFGGLPITLRLRNVKIGLFESVFFSKGFEKYLFFSSRWGGCNLEADEHLGWTTFWKHKKWKFCAEFDLLNEYELHIILKPRQCAVGIYTFRSIRVFQLFNKSMFNGTLKIGFYWYQKTLIV